MSLQIADFSHRKSKVGPKLSGAGAGILSNACKKSPELLRGWLARRTSGELRVCFGELEQARVAAGIASTRLAGEAGASIRTYERMCAGTRGVTARTLSRFIRALDRLTHGDIGRGRVLAVAAEGLEPGAELLLLRCAWHVFRACATVASIHWQGARFSPSQLATYLVVTEIGARQADVAKAIGLTGAAICQACQAMEDRRDEPAFEALVETTAAAVIGGKR